MSTGSGGSKSFASSRDGDGLAGDQQRGFQDALDLGDVARRLLVGGGSRHDRRFVVQVDHALVGGERERRARRSA